MPKDDGIVPINAIQIRSKLVERDEYHKEDGMAPVKAFSDICNLANCVNSPICIGIVPVAVTLGGVALDSTVGHSAGDKSIQ
jgi:hypothetical protein